MADRRVRDIRITFLIFSGIFSLYAYRHYPSVPSYFLVAFAIILLLLLTISPLTLTPLYELWLKFSRILAKVNTTILLMLIFAFIFVPTGFVRRMLGKDPMQRRLRCGESYWEPYELSGLKDRSRYEKQF